MENPIDRPVRVRFALPASESLSLAEARISLINSLFAVKHSGKLILRAEGAETSNPEALQKLYEELLWLKVSWHEGPDVGGETGPYLRSERASIYQDYVQRLLSEGKAYPCYCSAEKLDEEKRRFLAQGKPPRYVGTCRTLSAEAKAEFEAQGIKPSLRLKVDRQIVKYLDGIHGEKVADSEILGDGVLMLTDGRPSYPFSSALDDGLMKISHVIRSEKDVSHTPQEILIFRALGWEPPAYAHLPMVLGPDHTLLSTKHGPSTIAELKGRGYFAPTVIHYLLTLGWTTPVREDMDLEEIVRKFDLKSISKVSPVFDWERLASMNGRQLRDLETSEFLHQCETYVAGYGEALTLKGQPWLEATLELLRKQCRSFQEVGDVLKIFVKPLGSYEEGAEKALKLKDAPRVLKGVMEALQAPENAELNADTAARILDQLKEKIKSKSKNLFASLRVALTGRTDGPDLPLTLSLLGKEEILKRIDHALTHLQHAPADKGAV